MSCNKGKSRSLQPPRILPIDRIVVNVGEQIGIAACKEDGVFGGPTTGFRIVIPRTEAGEAGIFVIQATGKAKGLEAGVAVGGDGTPNIVIDALGHTAILGIDDQTWATYVIADDPVDDAVLNEV